MAIIFPNNKQEIDKLRANFKNQLSTINPYKEGTFLDAIIKSLALNFSLTYEYFKNNIFNNILPFNPKGEWAEYWADIWGLDRIQALKSSGYINFTGEKDINIPIGTNVIDNDDNLYTTLEDATIAQQFINITSLTQIGGVATAVTSSDHNLSTGMVVTIAYVNEYEYIGIKTITVTKSDEFTYNVISTATTPATIQPTYASIQLYLNVSRIAAESVEVGIDKNLVAFTKLTLFPTILDVAENAYVDGGGFSGGRDLETDDELNLRTNQIWGKPIPAFSEGYINNIIQNEFGASRVWTQPVTPSVGHFTTYFIYTYNDNKFLPTSNDLVESKDLLISKKPAILPSVNIHVAAPTPIDVDYTFTSLTPNTPEMQKAITDNLKKFHYDYVNVGENITRKAYEVAIQNTLDVNGQSITEFTLSLPSGDITINDDEIGKLGTITF